MNVPLLLEIKARILAEPDAFRMDTWTCGTAHCIAGWALMLNDKKIVNPTASSWEQRTTDGDYPGEAAAALLGLNGYQRNSLFMVTYWPIWFYAQYFDARRNRPVLAQIAAKRIDHFIATKGEE